MTEKPCPIRAMKSNYPANVSVSVKLNTGWDGDHVRLDGSTNLTTDQARALGQSLIALADAADAKAAAHAAVEARRRAWRDREIAAGRMKVFSFGGRA